MRAYDCNHNGQVVRLTGRDDEELFKNLKSHLAEVHPDLNLTDEQIRGAISANVFDE